MVVAVVLAGTVACSNEPPPQGDSPPLVSVTPTSPTPSPTSSEPSLPSPAKIADTLCVRMDPNAVTRILKVRNTKLSTDPTSTTVDVPTYDVCTLDMTTGTDARTKRPIQTPLQVGVSVLPATAADLAAARRAYTTTQGRFDPARTAAVGQGGYGTRRFVVFLSNGRLVKVSSGLGTRATYAGYLAVAREVAKHTAGLPVQQPMVALEECERGSASAAKVIGAEPVIRRDRRNEYGDIECGWATRTRAVYSAATRVANARRIFQQNSSLPTAERVPLGDDALYDAESHGIQVRSGETKIAYFTPVPFGTGAKNDMIAFALRLSPLYTR